MKNIRSRPAFRAARLFATALAVAGAVAPTVAAAQNITRVNATRLSCDALLDIIDERGAVIVKSRSLRSNVMLSERYVSNRGFCFSEEIISRRTIATRDTDRCPVNLCTDRINRRSNR